MTQKFYLHDAATSDTGTLPTTWQGTGGHQATDASANVDKAMDGVIGSSQADHPTDTTIIADSVTWVRTWVSSPLGAQTIGAGTWTFSDALSSPGSLSMQNVGIIFVWRPSNGTLVGKIWDNTAIGPGDGPFTTSSTEAAISYTVSGSSLVIQNGDILVLQLGIYNGEISLSNFAHVFYDGTTEGSASSNAAYLQAPADLPLSGPYTPGYFAWPRATS